MIGYSPPFLPSNAFTKSERISQVDASEVTEGVTESPCFIEQNRLSRFVKHGKYLACLRITRAALKHVSVGKSLMARSLGEAAAQPHSMPSALAYYRFYHPLDSMKIMRHFEQS